MKAIYTRAAIPLVILLVHISTATAQNIGVKKMPRQIDHSMAARSEVTLNRGLTSAYEETESGAGGGGRKVVSRRVIKLVESPVHQERL